MNKARPAGPQLRSASRETGEYRHDKPSGVKPYIQTTIDSDFSSKLHNILNKQFNPDQPDAVWVSDITYIWTFDGLCALNQHYGSVFPENHWMCARRDTGSISCGRLHREGEENPQNHTAWYSNILKIFITR